MTCTRPAVVLPTGIPLPTLASATFAPHAVLAMQAYAWPGNVRELENRIQRALIMATGPQITPADLELPSTEVPGPPRTLKEARDEVEKALVVQGLARNHGNVTRTAADLGVSRPTQLFFSLASVFFTVEEPGAILQRFDSKNDI
jgi:DNA-binding NtrC family response regulator